MFWFVVLCSSVVSGLLRELFWLAQFSFLFGWLAALFLFITALPSSTIYSFFCTRVLRRAPATSGSSSPPSSGEMYKDKPVGHLPTHASPGTPVSSSHATSIHPHQNHVAILLVCSLVMTAGFLYSRETFYQQDVCWAQPLSGLTNGTFFVAHSPWFVVALPTVARYGSERYLINTIDSLLIQLPEDLSSFLGFLYNNFKIVVVNNVRGDPEGHSVYKAAEKVRTVLLPALSHLNFVAFLKFC